MDFDKILTIHNVGDNKWESLGYGVYRHKETGVYKSEELEYGMPKGFRVIGEIQTDELTGEIKKL